MKDHGSARGAVVVWGMGGLALMAISVAGIVWGVTPLSFERILADPEAQMIVLELRLPRVLFALLVGGALAMVGASYQTLFRNPLASPFTLGVSSGAALGASLALVTGSNAITVSASAISGALVSILFILTVSRRLGESAGDALLLVGIVFSLFCSSILTMLQYVSDYSQLFRVTRWMMGGVPAVGWGDIALGAALVAVFFIWIQRKHREFDLMLFGDEIAAVRGTQVQSLYYTTFVLSSLVVGWIVSQCGVIGFVGIVVPAIARHIVGLRHRVLVPLSFLLGAILVVACDLLGRLVRPPFEVPAGVFTAIIGGPVFILVAITSLRRWR